MGMKSKRKGYRIEAELVQRHQAAGIDAERVPLSGAAGGSHSGDLVVKGRYRAEVKARANGSGFKTLEGWLGDNQLLFLRRDRAEPLVCMPWYIYLILMGNEGAKNDDASGDKDIQENGL